VIVADAAMLSAENIDNLSERGYQFIVGARVMSILSAVIL
jgi:transposase